MLRQGWSHGTEWIGGLQRDLLQGRNGRLGRGLATPRLNFAWKENRALLFVLPGDSNRTFFLPFGSFLVIQ